MVSLGLLLSGAGLLQACGASKDESIGVYSGRHYNTDQELYERFTQETGIRVELLEAKDDALIQRLRSEGDNSPADVLILADAARLDRAAGLNLFQPVSSNVLSQAIPATAPKAAQAVPKRAATGASMRRAPTRSRKRPISGRQKAAAIVASP